MARRGGHKKRKQGLTREPNGRVSRKKEYQRELQDKQREETEAEAMAVGIAKRVSSGIPRHLARSVGTVEGTLFAKGDINRDQYEAALFYGLLRIQYLSAIDEPHSPKEPRKPSQGGGEEAHERFCAGSIQRWKEMREQISEAQQQLGNTANLFGALDSLERGHMSKHQIGDLRYALNAVHKFRVNATKRAA
ncbi:hypothetical protein [Roseibium album]|uniref:hypothetical protein n=1 Tax=Roseibium album TaxID=311410 RepID=UPI003BAE4965